MMKHKWKKRSGEGYIDTCVLILCAMLVIALAVKVLPVYVAKQQLDTFAAELVREADLPCAGAFRAVGDRPGHPLVSHRPHPA